MVEVGVKDARTSWSALVALAEQGEVITITRRGKPVAMIVPSEKSSASPQPNTDPSIDMPSPLI